MWFVLAFDKKRNIAVLGEEYLKAVSVFDNRDLLTIERDDFENTAIKFLIIDRAEFDEQGNLHLLYRNNSQGKSEAVIDSKEFDK